jgi:hypothetical protein
VANTAAAIGEAFTFSMKTKASVVKTDEKGNTKPIGDVILGDLVWGTNSYQARSGPWGQGALPAGPYTVDWSDIVEGSPLSSDDDFGSGFQFTVATTLKTSTKIVDADGTAAKRTLTGFFVPIQADFDSSRGDLGIHPDGNVYGTQGCIGLVDNDAARFWRKVLDTPRKNRPKKLMVSGAPILAKDPISVSGNAANE